jgi:hypothetical protein
MAIKKMFYFSKLGHLSRSNHIILKYKDCLDYEKLTQQLKMFVGVFVNIRSVLQLQKETEKSLFKFSNRPVIVLPIIGGQGEKKKT